LTLVELVVAAGLLSILMVVLFGLLDSFLSMWERSEQRRQLAEGSLGIVDLLAEDFAALEGGTRGDLLCEWVAFDVDGDGSPETKWPRLRLVRRASQARLAQLQAHAADREAGEGLLEVCWALLPARTLGPRPVAGSASAAAAGDAAARRDGLAEGFLWRGERLYGSRDATHPSFFSTAFVSGTGRPQPGALDEVSGGVLWLGMQFATESSSLHDDWRTGSDPADVVASWDAWNRGRPDADAHWWNEPAAGMPAAGDRPRLPRRVRFELELERPGDLKRRTRLERLVDARASTLAVLDDERLPGVGPAAAAEREAPRYVCVDAEWMRVLAVSAGAVQVQRGARGTTPRAHEAGALVHYGTTLVREVPIALHREDWTP